MVCSSLDRTWASVRGSERARERKREEGGAVKYLYAPVEVHSGAREMRKSCVTSMFMQEHVNCGGCLGD